MKILVTGGCGYIGSHTVVELQNAGIEVVVIDNLCNSNEKSLARVSEITGKDIEFYNIDIRDFNSLDKLLENRHFDCCIHFAGLKAVGESVQKPLEYNDNNDRIASDDDAEETYIWRGVFGGVGSGSCYGSTKTGLDL